MCPWLRGRVLAVDDRQIAVQDEARGIVDLREQDHLAQLAVRRDDRRARVHRIADPQVTGVLGEKAPALGRWATHRPRRDPSGGEQAMHGGTCELAALHQAGALEHADDALSRYRAVPRASRRLGKVETEVGTRSR